MLVDLRVTEAAFRWGREQLLLLRLRHRLIYHHRLWYVNSLCLCLRQGGNHVVLETLNHKKDATHQIRILCSHHRHMMLTECLIKLADVFLHASALVNVRMHGVRPKLNPTGTGVSIRPVPGIAACLVFRLNHPICII